VLSPVSFVGRPLKIAVLGLALVGPVMLGGCDRQSGDKAQPAASSPPGQALAKLDRSQQGKPLPDVTVADPGGAQLRLAGLAGEPVLINLWATWCAPCVVELPTLQSIANRADVGVRVLTVSQDMGEPAKVQAFLDERGLAQLPAWIDGKGDLPIHYGVQTLPATILYDASGKEVWRFLGERDWSSAESLALIAEATARR
jgi:thiol-disulfide isomerase/thioredoxin